MSGAPGPDGLGVGLGDVGQALEPHLDFVHAHVMAYYHNIQIQDAWNYTMNQVLWYKKYIPQLPLIISEVSIQCLLTLVMYQGFSIYEYVTNKPLMSIDDVGYGIQRAARRWVCDWLCRRRGQRGRLHNLLEDCRCQLRVPQGEEHGVLYPRVEGGGNPGYVAAGWVCDDS
jgi:hypothetical protein